MWAFYIFNGYGVRFFYAFCITDSRINSSAHPRFSGNFRIRQRRSAKNGGKVRIPARSPLLSDTNHSRLREFHSRIYTRQMLISNIILRFFPTTHLHPEFLPENKHGGRGRACGSIEVIVSRRDYQS